jgi:Tfp pilus assembly protein PilF
MESFVIGAIVGLMMLAFLTVVNKGKEKLSDAKDVAELEEIKRKIADGSKTTNDMISEAYSKMFKGQLGEAMRSFEKILIVSPLEAEALNALAYYYYDNVNRERGFTYAQKLFDESLNIQSLNNWDEFIYQYVDKQKSEGKLTLSLPQLRSNFNNYYNRIKEISPDKAKHIETSIFFQNIIRLAD